MLLFAPVFYKCNQHNPVSYILEGTFIPNPSILFSIPTRNETNVSINPAIQIHFTQPMDPSTLSSAIHLYQQDTELPFQNTIDDNSKDVNIQVETFLKNLTEYRLVVDTNAKGLRGTPLEKSYEAVFRTGSSNLEILAPKNGKTGVSLTPNIILYSPIPLKINDLREEITFLDDEGNTIPFEIKEAADGHYEIVNENPLDYHTTYTITASEYVEAENGAVTGTSLISSFTTIFIDQTPPAIQTFSIDSSSPTNNPTISITLEAVDNVGVVKYLVNESNQTPNPSSFMETSPPTQYTLSSEGNTTLYAWALDLSNHVSAAYPGQSVVYDVTPPLVTNFEVSRAATVCNMDTNVTVTIAANDSSAIVKYFVKEEGSTPTKESFDSCTTCSTESTFTITRSAGTDWKDFYVWVMDAAGNISQDFPKQSLYFSLDWKVTGKIYWQDYQCKMNEAISMGTTGAVTVSQFASAGDATADKWAGGVLAPNGKIYGIPSAATSILEIDPSDDSSALIGTGLSGGWVGGVLAPNGKIFGIPWNGTTILEFNPETLDIVEFASPQNDYYGAIVGPDGLIYCIPYDASNVLVIDPETRETKSIGSGGPKWAQGVLAPDGTIIGIPRDSSTVLVIDPTLQDVRFFGNLVETTFWNGGSITPNGKIYSIPRGNTQILEIDSLTESTTKFGNVPGANKYLGQALAPNGKIYAIPRYSEYVAEIDPETKTVTNVGPSLGASLNKWCEGVLAPNGKIYGLPASSTDVLVIDVHAVMNFDNNLLLSAYLNKY